MSEIEKYEKLRAYIKQKITDTDNSIDSGGAAEKLAKQIQLHVLYEISDMMTHLDEQESKEL